MKALLALILVATSAPALAAWAPQDQSSAQTPPIVVNGAQPPAPPRQICRRVEALTGSHVSRVRVCHTAAQWRAMSDSSVDDSMDDLSVINTEQGTPANGVTPRGGRPQ
jgi:hypothetical protein